MSAGPVAAVLVAALLFLAWQVSGGLLLIFAGLIFASLLDAGTVGLQSVLPIARQWRLALICTALLLGLGAGIALGGLSLVDQANALAEVLTTQLDELRRLARSAGVTPQSLGAAPDQSFSDLLLPDTATVLGHARDLFGNTLGWLGNAVVIAFIGLFVAADPALYRNGLIGLMPERRRARTGAMLDEMALALRWWLVGQAAIMVLVALTTWAALALIGMPSALLLGLIAGLFNFIPYLGPVLGAIPLALAAMPLGLEMLAWAIGAYVLVQTIEGYILAPLIQRRTVDVAPAVSLGGIVLFGALFGGLGIALATPLIAMLRIGLETARRPHGGERGADHRTVT